MIPASTLATKRSLIENISDPALGNRWNEFDRTYRRVILGMAKSSGLQHHDAEDLTQDIFRELTESLIGFKLGERRGSFRNFLFRLVHWRVTDKKKQLQRTQHTPLDADDSVIPEPAVADGVACAESDFQQVVTGAMGALAKKLSDRDLQVLEMYYCANKPGAEIAKTLHIKPATIYVIVHRNKGLLAREIRRRL